MSRPPMSRRAGGRAGRQTRRNRRRKRFPYNMICGGGGVLPSVASRRKRLAPLCNRQRTALTHFFPFFALTRFCSASTRLERLRQGRDSPRFRQSDRDRMAKGVRPSVGRLQRRRRRHGALLPHSGHGQVRSNTDHPWFQYQNFIMKICAIHV